jgi:Protein of unknown function (DUF2934)
MDTQQPRQTPVKTRRVVTTKISTTDTGAVPSKPPVSACDDFQLLIARRAHELHVERGYRDGHALDDWLEAEREILSQVPPTH